MNREQLKNLIRTAHTAAWNLIKKLPEAFKHASPKTGEKLADALKFDSHSVRAAATSGLVTLAGLFGGSQASAQNYQVGDQVSIGGFTCVVTQTSTQTQRQQGSTISYQQAQRVAQSPRSQVSYGRAQSPLARAQNSIKQNNLVVDAEMTKNLNPEEYSYACCPINPSGYVNKNLICLVRRDGSITGTETRDNCFSRQTGGNAPWGCNPGRRIGIQEATQLAQSGISIINHTDETRQAFGSVMVEEALMDGAVAAPSKEVQWYGRQGYHYDRLLSTGIKWDSDVYQVMVKGRGELERGVIIYKTPRYNEQTGEVSCAEEIGRQRLAELRGEARGSKGNAGIYYQRGSRGGYRW